MLNRLILLIYDASSGLKRTGIRFIAYSLHPVVCCARDHLSPNPLRFRSLWKMGMIDLIYVDHHVLLSQQMPVIKHVAGDTFVFQQDNAPSHRVKDTIKLLQQETLDFVGTDLWPPNSPDLNPVSDYEVWVVIAESA